MPCVRDDGSLTVTAIKIMTAIRQPVTMEDVAVAASMPLFRVRSSVRQLEDAGLVESQGGKYTRTAEGEKRLAAQT